MKVTYKLVTYFAVCLCLAFFPLNSGGSGPYVTAISHVMSLQGDSPCHIQGITMSGPWLFTSCVERVAKKAWIYRYQIPEGFPEPSVSFLPPKKLDVTRGEMYHPSGLAHDSECIWVAVSHYRKKKASSRVICLDPETLTEKNSFEIRDHIGAIGLSNERLALFNWDSRDIHLYSREGKFIARHPSPSKIAYQDCARSVDVSAFSCSGPDKVAGKKGARVETLEPAGGEEGMFKVTFSEFVSHPGVALGREGFDRPPGGNFMLFAPEDFPKARLFYFISL